MTSFVGLSPDRKFYVGTAIRASTTSVVNFARNDGKIFFRSPNDESLKKPGKTPVSIVAKISYFDLTWGTFSVTFWYRLTNKRKEN